MMKKMTFLLGAVALVICGCKKPITQPNAGIYRGTFMQFFDNGDTNAQGVANLALSGDTFGGTFTLSGDTATGAPISCAGVYEINGAVTMTFKNTSVVEDLGYQPHYILDTLYQYTFDDHFFTLKMKHDTTNYEYQLKRN